MKADNTSLKIYTRRLDDMERGLSTRRKALSELVERYESLGAERDRVRENIDKLIAEPIEAVATTATHARTRKRMSKRNRVLCAIVHRKKSGIMHICAYLQTLHVKIKPAEVYATLEPICKGLVADGLITAEVADNDTLYTATQAGVEKAYQVRGRPVPTGKIGVPSLVGKTNLVTTWLMQQVNAGRVVADGYSYEAIAAAVSSTVKAAEHHVRKLVDDGFLERTAPGRFGPTPKLTEMAQSLIQPQQPLAQAVANV